MQIIFKPCNFFFFFFCRLWLNPAHCLGLQEKPLTPSNQSYHHWGKFRTVETVNWPLVGKTTVTALTGADSPVGPAEKTDTGDTSSSSSHHSTREHRPNGVHSLSLLSWPRTRFMLHAGDSVVASPFYFKLDLLCPPPLTFHFGLNSTLSWANMWPNGESWPLWPRKPDTEV